MKYKEWLVYAIFYPIKLMNHNRTNLAHMSELLRQLQNKNPYHLLNHYFAIFQFACAKIIKNKQM